MGPENGLIIVMSIVEEEKSATPPRGIISEERFTVVNTQ
jgi:hypothetical protein